MWCALIYIRPRLSECVQNMYKYEPYMWYDIKYIYIYIYNIYKNVLLLIYILYDRYESVFEYL